MELKDCKQKAAERGIDTGIVTCGKQQKQSPASVGVKEELMELSVSQNLENRVDGVFSDEVAVIGSVVTERNAQLSDLSLELKAESEKNTTIIHNIQPDWNNCSLTDYEEGMENSLAVEGQNKNTQYIPYANSNGEAGDREQEKEQQLYDTYLQQTPDVQCTFIQIDGTVTASVPHNPEGQTGSSLICNLCGKRLSSERRLREHIKTHASLRPYTCPQCGKSFTRKASMNFHQNIHRGVKPYACDICPKSFADPSALRRHKSIHK
ncbi:zinc finger protein 84-like isoform X2 [Hoplias malabaricus]|uniref:zinc finger protein 84-like isoform X2 n=1 Tax=Hoplias malabaricus TaxID=27720 RepID=UPI0034623FFE